MKVAAVVLIAIALAVPAFAASGMDACGGAGGSCTTGSCANGDFKRGLCPGTSVCCVPWTTPAGCKNLSGVCAAAAGCKGKQTKGLCPGSSVCCSAVAASTPVTPAPAPVTPAPAPVTPAPVPSSGDVGVVKIIPKGTGQIGFCSADGKNVGLCKTAAACGKLAGFTAKTGICTHSQVCCTPPAGGRIDGQLGIDVEGSVISAKTAQCYKDTGFSFFMVRVWRTSNIVDSTCAANLRALSAVGIKDLDVYMFHDYRKDVVSAVNTMMNYLVKENVLGLVKRVWLDIERDINGAYMWSRTDKKANLQKLLNAIEAVKKFGKLPGVYAPGAGGWEEIMGTGKVNDNVPMWYVSNKGYDNDASDNSFVPFANWQSSAPGLIQHQFYSGDGSGFKVCGVSGLDWTYRKAPITLPYNWDVKNGKAI